MSELLISRREFLDLTFGAGSRRTLRKVVGEWRTPPGFPPSEIINDAIIATFAAGLWPKKGLGKRGTMWIDTIGNSDVTFYTAKHAFPQNNPDLVDSARILFAPGTQSDPIDLDIHEIITSTDRDQARIRVARDNPWFVGLPVQAE
jgi:hypothetical protein